MGDVDIDNIIAKVQKLLALGTSPNENEAKAAVAKAKQLMDQFNLSRAEIEAYVDSDWKEDELEEFGQTLPYEVESIIFILDKYFFVKMWIRTEIVSNPAGKQKKAKLEQLKKAGIKVGRKRPRTQKSITKIMIFGEPQNIEMAKYLYYYLRRIYRELYAKYKTTVTFSKYQSRGVAKSYYVGLTRGFREKLARERELQTNDSLNALVVINTKIDEAFAERYSDLVESDSKCVWNAQAFNAGVKDGNKIEINKPVGTEEGTEKSLIGVK